MILSPAQADALKAAGGCDCTPDPFRACDTCGRPAIPGRQDGAVTYNWQAVTVDGKTIDKRDVISFHNLPLDKVCRVNVVTDDPRIPMMVLSCDPRKGERVFVFTRHAVRLATAGRARGRLSVPVIEVRHQPDGPFTRLYLHPDHPILSTEDLYF